MRSILPILALAIPTGLAAQAQTFVLPKGSDTTQTTVYDSCLGAAGYDRSATSCAPIHVMEGYATSEMPTPAVKVQEPDLPAQQLLRQPDLRQRDRHDDRDVDRRQRALEAGRRPTPATTARTRVPCSARAAAQER
ncbi:MAG: hypothetical protein R3F30_03165 [Planctomycetota bacterium]